MIQQSLTWLDTATLETKPTSTSTMPFRHRGHVREATVGLQTMTAIIRSPKISLARARGRL